MTRRARTIVEKCGAAGCKESRMVEYESARSRREQWQCFRHRDPSKVLSEANRGTCEILTVVVRSDIGGRKFFGKGSGMVSGPGFVAVAEDFPEGTRIQITSRVLPETETGQSTPNPQETAQ